MTTQAVTQKTIKVDYMARVEGEGALDIVTEDGKITHLQLRIFEPPRFFEAFLRGREFREAPDITARICGICPVAYQMSSVHALETALGVNVGTKIPAIRDLRRLFYCGEWIESHALHVYMLHAPDFLGYESAISMAAEPTLKPAVERGLRMKKIGNHLLKIIGGREVHPINPCVGGFYQAPKASELQALRDDLLWGLEASLETIAWTATLPFPDFTQDYEYVALRHPDEYPMNEGRVISSQGLDIPMAAYEEYFTEEHVAHSNALHARRIDGGSYQVGPLARLNLNLDRLPPATEKALAATNITFPNHNPFVSIVARAVETALAFEEALRIIDGYQQPAQSRLPLDIQAGTGCHLTEAPRGLLYHHYQIDDAGLIEEARIWAPTSQNLKRMEDDLWAFVPNVLELPDDETTLRCEQLVRSYDPCISCATHFLTLNLTQH